MKLKFIVVTRLLLITGMFLGACVPVTGRPSVGTPRTAVQPTAIVQVDTAVPATPTTEAAQAAETPSPLPNPTATPTKTVPAADQAEAEPFKAWLSESIASRNYAELQKLMGNDFYFGMLQSEAGKETPEDAIRLLKGFFGDNHVVFVPPQEAASLLKSDPLALLSPEVKNPDYLLAKNVGTYGKDGAILYIAQKPDGSYYWFGLLVARGGF